MKEASNRITWKGRVESACFDNFGSSDFLGTVTKEQEVPGNGLVIIRSSGNTGECKQVKIEVEGKKRRRTRIGARPLNLFESLLTMSPVALPRKDIAQVYAASLSTGSTQIFTGSLYPPHLPLKEKGPGK